MEQNKLVVQETIKYLTQTFSESDNNKRQKAEKRLKELCINIILNLK